MRFSARLLFFVISTFLLLGTTVTQVAAQTVTPTPQPVSSYEQFRTPNVDNSVPRDSHFYTQAVMIDTLSALICQLTGTDPTSPHLGCLGVNPQTGTIGMAPSRDDVASGAPQVGGALGLSANLIGGVYTQSVSSTQYFHYLADNFGIAKPALAASPPPATGVQEDCSGSAFGYGFCGLKPVFTLWKVLRDASYGLLTLVFIVLGVGVMVRFKVDPRTVMTLQNQIPRVIVSILLITFSYAIAGAMIDLMWTVTYMGVSAISSATPNSKIALSCASDPNQNVGGTSGGDMITPISAANQMLINQPLSFANKLFLPDCNGNTNGGINGGIINMAARVSDSVRGLVTGILNNLFGWNPDGAGNTECGLLHPVNCLTQFGLWITQLIVIAIIIIAILIALFRLWFELIKTYITILIFVIMGPIWIVFGLIPGRPLGFEKWLRIMFANLAAYPLCAFILVFGRVMMDAATPNPDPHSVFVPPLIGNPNVQSFSVFIGFGAIMIAPTIPAMIKERMKAKGQGNYGKTVAAGLGFAAGVATTPGKKTWESLNHKNATTGAPEGALAVAKQQLWQKTPVLGRRAVARKAALHKAYGSGDYSNVGRDTKKRMQSLKTNAPFAKREALIDKKANLDAKINKTTFPSNLTNRLFARRSRSKRLENKIGNQVQGPSRPTDED